MPRKSEGARLWFDDKTGLWYIRDGTRKRGTGCGAGEREGAEARLAEYITQKYEPPRDNRPDRLFVADVLTYYNRVVAPGHRSKSSSYAVEALMGWWGAKLLSDVKRSTCQAYVEWRVSQPIGQARSDAAKKVKVRIDTPRRELAVLRAAINAYHKESPLDALPVVSMPKASPPRVRFLSRAEAARLLRAARNLKDKDARQALVRFIRLGLYTGTRSGAIRALGWLPNVSGGWIDLNAGVIHRRGERETESNKRRPSSRLPSILMRSLASWRAADLGQKVPVAYVVHYRGQPVEKQRKSWAEACAKAKLGKDVTPHVLRHTAVTWMMLNGNDPYDVAAYVGMSVKMLDDVYGHHHPDHQHALARNIGRKRLTAT